MAAVTDKRLLRGARTRGSVLRAAVDLASTEGLEGLSFGRLATATGLSKAGVQTLFRTKEALQLATIGLAGEMFGEAVITPAESAAPGIGRVDALLERWIDYVQAPLFAGGCFWIATLAEQDSRPGPLRDALLRQRRRWRTLLIEQLEHAVEHGQVEPLDVELAVFEFNAVLGAVNTAVLVGEPEAGDHARRAVRALMHRGR